jgi:hypothetical protein
MTTPPLRSSMRSDTSSVRGRADGTGTTFHVDENILNDQQAVNNRLKHHEHDQSLYRICEATSSHCISSATTATTTTTTDKSHALSAPIITGFSSPVMGRRHNTATTTTHTTATNGELRVSWSDNNRRERYEPSPHTTQSQPAHERSIDSKDCHSPHRYSQHHSFTGAARPFQVRTNKPALFCFSCCTNTCS